MSCDFWYVIQYLLSEENANRLSTTELCPRFTIEGNFDLN